MSAYLTAAGLAQSVECLNEEREVAGSIPGTGSIHTVTVEREVAGSIPGAGPILRVLKYLRNEGNPFAIQAGRPKRDSDDLVKWRVRLQLEK